MHSVGLNDGHMMSQINVAHISRYRQHIPVLAGWLFDHWGKTLNVEDPAGQAVFMQRCAVGDELPTGFVAMDGAAPLGFACLMNGDLPTRPDLNPWLAQVYVTQAARGRGAGKALVKAIVAEAQRLGYSVVYLYTSGWKVQFYESMGWREIGTEDFRDMHITIMQIEPE
jgi:GNAT superfamily N-acetyltransferase